MIAYLDMDQVGAWFGVGRATVTKWRTRYAASHPCPEPDAMTGGRTPGWLPSREAEWRAWEATRPGQTSGLQRGRTPAASALADLLDPEQMKEALRPIGELVRSVRFNVPDA